MYESVAHDECDVVFGIDLRKWSEVALSPMSEGSPEKKGEVPPVLSAMLSALSDAYAQLPNDSGERGRICCVYSFHTK